MARRNKRGRLEAFLSCFARLLVSLFFVAAFFLGSAAVALIGVGLLILMQLEEMRVLDGQRNAKLDELIRAIYAMPAAPPSAPKPMEMETTPGAVAAEDVLLNGPPVPQRTTMHRYKVYGTLIKDPNKRGHATINAHDPDEAREVAESRGMRVQSVEEIAAEDGE